MVPLFTFSYCSEDGLAMCVTGCSFSGCKGNRKSNGCQNRDTFSSPSVTLLSLPVKFIND